MIFVRHNSLIPPFHDYSTLTLDMLDDLATCKVSPDIASLPDELFWSEQMVEEFKNAEFFVCSEAIRTQQTCKTLMELYNVQKEIVVDENLNEIFFVPSALIEDETEAPLLALRNRFYKGIAENHEGIESVVDLQQRIDRVIEKYEHKNCVMFSHGFLIRLLKGLYLHDNDMHKALANIDEVSPVDYLEAFVNV